MNKRVYGVLGISAVMANWNADFSGFPKTTTGGATFGSDKAFKYPIKKMWEDAGEKVVYIKSMTISEPDKNGDTQVVPRTLRERYEQIFEVEDLKKDKDARKILTNLFSAIDVKNFGATFAEEGTNLSITGAVQIGQGFNKYEESEAQEQNILSPFRDPKAKEKSKERSKDGEGEDAKSSTLGTKIVSDEAHYFYPFTVNPSAYNGFVDMGVTEGYTEEDYQKFKAAALSAATSFATNAKAGCENEFGLFVETAANLYLPNLDKYITFTKGEGGTANTIAIECSNLLNDVGDKIQSVEIHYNPYTTVVKSDIENAEYFNIFTGKKL